MKNNQTLTRKWLLTAPAALFAVITANAPSFAQEPLNGQLNLQAPATSSAERIYDFHTLLLYVISVIVAFVFLLLLFVIVRFNAKTNPVPSKTTHNVPLEIMWTLIPVLILLVIAVPSLKTLYENDRIVEADMTLKVTGFQWYWNYEYPEHGFAFDSRIIPDKEINPAAGQKRLLSTDNAVYLPIETNIRLLTTANDVIHAWAVPSFGIKMDAMPGRTNETWFRISKPGVYYGQCSEICGKDHAFMPIEIHAVSQQEFTAWVEKAKTEFAANNAPEEARRYASISQE